MTRRPRRNHTPAFRRVDFSRLVCLATTLTLTVLAFLNALGLSRKLVQNSDTVQSFLEGHDVLHGNVLLSGWSVQVDNFYFTDTLPFAAAEAFVGPDPRLLAIIPSILYALFVFVALASGFVRSRPLIRNLEVCVAAALLLASPHWFGNWDPLLFPDFHLGAILGALTVLWLSALWSDANFTRSRIARTSTIIAQLLLTVATVASDPFSLAFAFGPSLVVMGMDVAFDRLARKEIVPFLCLAAGVVLGAALPGAVASSGGFTTINLIQGTFVDASELGRNITSIIFGSLRVVGAYPFGLEPKSGAGVLMTIRCVGFSLMVASVYRVADKFFRGRTPPLFDRMLCASVLGVLAACCLAARYNGEIALGAEWSGGAAIRYLTPALLFAAVLAMRQIPDLIARLPTQRPRLAAQGALLLLAVPLAFGGEWFLDDVATQPDWISNPPPSAVVRWLEQRRLSHGVGEYWSSSLISALSRDTIRVAPVVPKGEKLRPYVLAASSRWYAQEPQFVIWQDVNGAGINLANVRATYAGRIRELALVAGYRIALLAQ